ncbi:MAG: DUF554 domain-containing protein [Deltaproteobacteria bacterium]|nr:DUF554 domain-containing protein [Deltaproteobacteria bacterium]
MITGTLLNVATVLAGSTGGVALGARLPERAQRIVMDGLGLGTLLIGAKMALQTQNILILLGSILLGGLLGEMLRIHQGLDRLGEALRKQVGVGQGSRFTEGFVTASLIFCVGPMTVMGSIEDGLTGRYQILAAKAVLDGFASLALAATLGWGVACAALTVLLFQGSLSLGASLLTRLITPAMVTEMTAAGGLMILGIGLLLLELRQIRVANFLPGLAVAPLLVALAGLR